MTEIEMVLCNECGRRTRHHIRADYDTLGVDDVVNWESHHSVLECGGCGTICYRTRMWFAEWQAPGGDPVFQDEFFPPRFERPVPAWFVNLSEELQDVLIETYEAYQADQRYLAAVGIRTSLDMAIVSQIGDEGSFQRKLEQVQAVGLIGAEEVQVLKAALAVGSAAAHRGFRPSRSDLDVMLDILESVLDGLFVKKDRDATMRSSAESMHRRVPPRRHGQRSDASGGPNGG